MDQEKKVYKPKSRQLRKETDKRGRVAVDLEKCKKKGNWEKKWTNGVV